MCNCLLLCQVMDVEGVNMHSLSNLIRQKLVTSKWQGNITDINIHEQTRRMLLLTKAKHP